MWSPCGPEAPGASHLRSSRLLSFAVRPVPGAFQDWCVSTGHRCGGEPTCTPDTVRRSRLTWGNRLIQALSCEKTLLLFVGVRYRSWSSCGPNVVPGLHSVGSTRSKPSWRKSTKSFWLSVTSGSWCRMQQAATHMSFWGRGRPRRWAAAGRPRCGRPWGRTE